ncbi:MAG: hypothetical protein LBH76_03855 [Propionibacteriaceae bacterium]|jgi:uncharacterized protein YqeY|nr:hypothetical protein [Propionibacteriaceae bacterium]
MAVTYETATTAIRAQLTSAVRAKDAPAIAAWRSLLSRLDNACAVPAPPAAEPTAASEHIAGAVAGVGAAEAPRRDLSAAEIEAIVAAEAASRSEAADWLDQAGRDRESTAARYQAKLLTRYHDAITGRHNA